MNDCQNAEIRDQLPDLVHERLDASARAAVLAHVEGCADCRDELQLLRDVRVVIGRTAPRVDVAYVVGALPKAPAPRTATAARRRTWMDWRVAAAVTLLVAGGGSYAVMRSDLGTNSRPPVSAPPTVARTQPQSIADSQNSQNTSIAAEANVARKPDVVATAEEHAAADLGGDGRLGDLSESQLRALLNDIANLKPVPVTEPEPVSLGVQAKLSSEGV